MAVATLWKLFQARWKNGCDSSLCPNARRICLARGKIPCDILFIGEAPSVSSDVIGRPFIGPTGNVLDDIIRRSVPKDVRCAFTNVVGCMPKDPGNKSKAIPPSDEAILACRPRL